MPTRTVTVAGKLQRYSKVEQPPQADDADDDGRTFLVECRLADGTGGLELVCSQNGYPAPVYALWPQQERSADIRQSAERVQDINWRPQRNGGRHYPGLRTTPWPPRNGGACLIDDCCLFLAWLVTCIIDDCLHLLALALLMTVSNFLHV